MKKLTLLFVLISVSCFSQDYGPGNVNIRPEQIKDFDKAVLKILASAPPNDKFLGNMGIFSPDNATFTCTEERIHGCVGIASTTKVQEDPWRISSISLENYQKLTGVRRFIFCKDSNDPGITITYEDLINLKHMSLLKENVDFTGYDLKLLKDILEVYKQNWILPQQLVHSIPVKINDDIIGKIIVTFVNGAYAYEVYFSDRKAEPTEIKYVLFDNTFCKFFFFFYVSSQIYWWVKRKVQIGMLAQKYEIPKVNSEDVSLWKMLKRFFYLTLYRKLEEKTKEQGC